MAPGFQPRKHYFLRSPPFSPLNPTSLNRRPSQKSLLLSSLSQRSYSAAKVGKNSCFLGGFFRLDEAWGGFGRSKRARDLQKIAQGERQERQEEPQAPEEVVDASDHCAEALRDLQGCLLCKRRSVSWRCRAHPIGSGYVFFFFFLLGFARMGLFECGFFSF